MKKMIGWWSGGATSAVACKLLIDMFDDMRHTNERMFDVRIIFIDTKNESGDTYRFKQDCEKWYGKKIETISAIPEKYASIGDVWDKYLSMNTANGAICSTELKRKVREKWQKENEYDYQAFGYEFVSREFNRAFAMSANHPKAKPIFPLLLMGYNKEQCFKIVEDAGIEIPVSYQLGFDNNNCLLTGCVQGGIGYWLKMRKVLPDNFDRMATKEHDLTNRKGRPVTMLKDQSKEAVASGNILVFLKKHPDYPNLKCIDDMRSGGIEPQMECNGFCGIDDLNPQSKIQQEINFEKE